MKIKVVQYNYKFRLMLNQNKIYNIKFCILFLLSLFFTVRPHITIFLLALGIAFLDFTKLKIKRLNKNRRYIILVCFWLYALAVSLVWEKWNHSLNLNFLYRIGWIVILIQVVTMNKDYISLLKMYKKIMIVCACFGIIEYVTKESTWSLFGLNVTGNLQYGAHRISVIFYNPLIYSTFLLITLWCEWCYPYKRKILHYLLISLFTINIVLTEARSAWAVLALGMIIFAVPKLKRFHLTTKKVVYAILIIVLMVGIGYMFRENLQVLMDVIILRLGSTSIREGSYIQRTGVIRNAVNFFVYNPVQFLIGGGYGYANIFIREHPVVMGFYAIDNQYIYYLLNYGLIGTAFFLKVTFWKMGSLMRRLGSIDCRFSVLCMLTIACSFFFFDAMSWPSFFICYALDWGAINHALKRKT